LRFAVTITSQYENTVTILLGNGRNVQDGVERGRKFACTGRKQKKRQFRSLWIVRISATAKLNNFIYLQLINGLKKAA
jgi:ribosomal protein L20